MSIAVGEVVRVVARMQNEVGTIIENVYHHVNAGTGAVTESAFLTGVETYLSGVYANIQAYMLTNINPVDIVCDVVSFSSGKIVTVRPVGVIAWTTWTGGSAGGEGAAQGDAAVVNFSTNETGIQGRKYFGPFSEAAQANGTLVAGFQAALAAAAADILSGFVVGAEGFIPCVMSYKAATFKLLYNAVVKAIVGYQRRRKTGVGI